MTRPANVRPVPPEIAARYTPLTVLPGETCLCDRCGEPLEIGRTVYVDVAGKAVHCAACVAEFGRQVRGEARCRDMET